MDKWWIWLLLGALSLIAGVFALANPLAASLTAELIAGWSFMLIGVLTVIGAFSAGETGTALKLLGFALGILFFILGLSLVMHPMRGLITLTWLAGILLIITGVFRFVFAFGTQGGARIAMLLSGALSILLAILIFANFPQSAAIILGIFLAIELISNGVSLIILAFMIKNQDKQTAL